MQTNNSDGMIEFRKILNKLNVFFDDNNLWFYFIDNNLHANCYY